MRTSVRTGLVLSAGALVLGMAGCGGDSEEPSVSATPTAVPSAPSLTPPFDLPTPGVDEPVPPIVPVSGLPSDFPADDVPLLPGAVSQPLGEGSSEEGKRGWVLEIDLEQKFEPCFRAAQRAVLDKGYVKQPGEIKDEGNWQAQFIGDEWVVIISTSPTDAGGCRLGYAVGQVRP